MRSEASPIVLEIDPYVLRMHRAAHLFYQDVTSDRACNCRVPYDVELNIISIMHESTDMPSA